MKTFHPFKNKYSRSFLLLATLAYTTAAQADWSEVSKTLDNIKPTLSGPQTIANYYGRNAMLLGNGDMGVAILSNDNQIEYHLSSNEFQGMIGRMYITHTSGGGKSSNHTAYHEQDMKHGEVIVNAKLSNTRLDTVNFIPYLEANHQNLLIVQLTNKDSVPVSLQILLEAESGGASGNGNSGNLAWVGRERENYDQWGTGKTFGWRTGFAAKLLGSATKISSGTSDNNQAYIACTLAANKTMDVVLCLESESGFTKLMPATSTFIIAAKNRATSASSTSTWKRTNRTWWKNYWTKSYAVLGHAVAEKYYYGALYNMGTSYRKGFAPPGLEGLWKFSDKDDLYFLNYNFQSGFFSFPSANRIDQMGCYIEPIWSVYNTRRYTTNTEGKFPGLSLGRYVSAGKGGMYFDTASMEAFGDIKEKNWDLAIDSSDKFRQYHRLDQQKSLSAYYAMPIINAYLYSEDMSILDCENPHLYLGVNKTKKGLSIYEVLLEMTRFYVSYITTECKDNASDNEWQTGDGAYTYRIYDSWAREPEPHETGIKVDVRPRDGTGDIDTNYDLSCIRHLLRGMIKIAQDRNDTTAPVAAWEDILDNLVDYPTTANDGISENDHLKTTYGTDVFKECKNRPEINYYSQGRDTYIGTHGQFVYPSDEVRENSTEAKMFRNTIKAVHSESRRTDSAATPKEDAPQFLKDIWVVFNDWNNFANLIPLMVRSFWDGEEILETLTYQQTHVLHNNMQFNHENLLQSNGPEANSIVDAINDMLLMSHFSEKAGAGTIGKAGTGSDDKAEDRYMKLFPVWPKNRNASFHQIRARGAFLVSASLNGGKVIRCEILSEKGNTCRIKNPWEGVGSMKVKRSTGGAIPTTKTGEIYSFSTTPGQSYILKRGN